MQSHYTEEFVTDDNRVYIICPDVNRAPITLEGCIAHAQNCSPATFGKDPRRNAFFAEYKGRIVRHVRFDVNRSAKAGRDNNAVREERYHEYEKEGYRRYFVDQEGFERAFAVRKIRPANPVKTKKVKS